MLEIYARYDVASNLPQPLDILAVTKKGRSIVAGTKSGALLVYSPTKDGNRRKYEVEMYRTFAKKPIIQLHAVDSKKLLFCLSDGLVSVHDTTEVNYPVKCTLLKAKGVSTFAVWCDEEGQGRQLYLAVALRRKLGVFRWTDRDFEEVHVELSFPDSIQTICWCSSRKLAVAVRDEYIMVTVFSNAKTSGTPFLGIGERLNAADTQAAGHTKELFPSNRPIDPLIIRLPDKNLVGFCRDDCILFAAPSGQIMSKEGFPEVRWSDIPISVAYDPPFLVALLPKCVEVRSLKPSALVQKLELPKARCLTDGCSNNVYAWGSHDIWALSSVGLCKDTIANLVAQKQYELAIQIALSTADFLPDVGLSSTAAAGECSDLVSSQERDDLVREIKHLYAFHSFCQKNFTLAFSLFSEIGSEVLYVIGLFPDLLPFEIRQNIKYPEEWSPRALAGEDLKKALHALAGYLSEIRAGIRRKIIAAKAKANEPSAADASPTPAEQLQQDRNLLQIVDTTLLRCYLDTNDMLVASLLRLPDNSCNVPNTEKLLTERQKFYELFLLYERKGMHNEALSLLKVNAKNEKSPLKGLDKTVHYLQNLGPTKLDSILKHAGWVLAENMQEGLKIFTEDCDEVKALDRDKVLQFLMRECSDAVVPYLEHILLQWSDNRPKFHDILAESYLVKVKALMKQYVQHLPAGHTAVSAGHEPGDLGRYRNKQLYFLGFSFHYSPELLLVQLPHDSLFEERALLLGRLKRHEQALAIYTNILHDYKAAERYCATYYKRQDKDDSKVYLTLLKMYAFPPDSSVLGLVGQGVSTGKPSPNIPQALKIMKDHADKLDTVESAQILAASTRLDELWPAVEAILQSTSLFRRKVDLHKALHFAAAVRAKSEAMAAENVRIDIGYSNGCAHCDKKIGNSAFVRFADGSLVHYYCFQQNKGVELPKRTSLPSYGVSR